LVTLKRRQEEYLYNYQINLSSRFNKQTERTRSN